MKGLLGMCILNLSCFVGSVVYCTVSGFFIVLTDGIADGLIKRKIVLHTNSCKPITAMYFSINFFKPMNWFSGKKSSTRVINFLCLDLVCFFSLMKSNFVWFLFQVIEYLYGSKRSGRRVEITIRYYYVSIIIW